MGDSALGVSAARGGIMLDMGWTPDTAGMILEALRIKGELRAKRLIDWLLPIYPNLRYVPYIEVGRKDD